MTVQYLNPAGLMQQTPYHHVAAASGTTHLYLSGQVSRAADGTPIAPYDLGGQVAQVMRNVATALAAAGASFENVVHQRFYVVKWRPEHTEEFMGALAAVAEEVGLAFPMPPTTLIGVESLFEPDILVELEASAVTDGVVQKTT